MTDKPDPDLIGRRKGYAEDFSKTVMPWNEVSVRFVGYSVEYGKVAISYLFLANAGGLAGLIALYPLVREQHQTWLQQSLSVGVCFALGLFFVAICAGTSYFNFTMNGLAFMARAANDDTWLKHWYFKIPLDVAKKHSTTNEQIERRSRRATTITAWVALLAGVASALFAAVGGLLTIYGLSKITLV